MCFERGIVTPATIADHVKSHRGDWNEFRLGALQSLCADCHNSKKRRQDIDGYSAAIGDDGWPTDPRHPANQLTGGRGPASC
jgi:5-methylcytosine-specific restriction enzyme A